MLRPALGPRLHPPHHSYAAIFTLHVYQGKSARKKSWNGRTEEEAAIVV